MNHQIKFSQLSEGEGEIKSPNYPENYPYKWDEVNTGYISTVFTFTTVNLTYCQAWNIEVASGQRIMLTFQSFDLQDKNRWHDWCDDYVQISFGSVAEKYCGSKLPTIISSGNTMTVVFHSERNGFDPKQGFKATWKAVETSGMLRLVIRK